jgi:hypothetical protein
MEVSVRLHGPAVLSPKKDSSTHLIENWLASEPVWAINLFNVIFI